MSDIFKGGVNVAFVEADSLLVFKGGVNVAFVEADSLLVFKAGVNFCWDENAVPPSGSTQDVVWAPPPLFPFVQPAVFLYP